MGNFIFGYNFVDFTPTASGETSPYVDDNLKLWQFPIRHYRSPNTLETTIVFDMATAHALLSVAMVDVNFSQFHIEGNDTNVWTSPSFRYPAVSGELSTTKDPETGRRSVYVPLSAFNYRYSRLVIPSQTPDNGDAYFRIGNVFLVDTLLELADNPSFPYEHSAYEKIRATEYESGGFEDVVLGGAIWRGSFGWDVSVREHAGDFWTLNSLGKNAILLFYENLGEDWRVYAIKRRTDIQLTWTDTSINRIQTLSFQEVR